MDDIGVGKYTYTFTVNGVVGTRVYVPFSCILSFPSSV